MTLRQIPVMEQLPGRARGTIGRVIHALPEVDSTNRLLAEMAGAGTVETGTVLLADHQTAGRGKYERPWVSTPGAGLYMSLLLRPARPVEDLAQVTLVIAVAVAEALEDVAGLRAGIKWPNDLLSGGRKLCGILCELVLTPEGDPAHVIAGIGLNIGQSRADFPDFLRDLATSVKAETGIATERDTLLAALLERLDQRLAEWECAGFGPARQEWSERSCTLGREIIMTASPAPVRGVAVALEADGSLSIRDRQGVIQNFVFGETCCPPEAPSRGLSGPAQLKEGNRENV
ncbi:MAG: biotin--[acetyl-CoA-carboxylase] ligase [Tropicimonas sp.]|uniref:biotin--[acetyl-CoA-carboxylase] ligase n=1 Tax=Tropicimonas sp. TaxID=2067044 RepID=UPI003A8AFC33